MTKEQEKEYESINKEVQKLVDYYNDPRIRDVVARAKKLEYDRGYDEGIEDISWQYDGGYDDGYRDGHENALSENANANFDCPHCGRKFAIANNVITFRCPHCGTVLEVQEYDEETATWNTKE